jgi:hypothetical protein
VVAHAGANGFWRTGPFLNEQLFCYTGFFARSRPLLLWCCFAEFLSLNGSFLSLVGKGLLARPRSLPPASFRTALQTPHQRLVRTAPNSLALAPSPRPRFERLQRLQPKTRRSPPHGAPKTCDRGAHRRERPDRRAARVNGSKGAAHVERQVVVLPACARTKGRDVSS